LVRSRSLKKEKGVNGVRNDEEEKGKVKTWDERIRDKGIAISHHRFKSEKFFLKSLIEKKY